MRAKLAFVAALVALSGSRTAAAQDFSLVNFEGAGHAGARVCFFAEGTDLYRASRIASGRILLPEVSMLAGHGGPGGGMATTPGQSLTAIQRAEVLGDYTWRVQRSGQRFGMQLNCNSGIPRGANACTAETCARMIASPTRTCATGLSTTQIGFTGILHGVPAGGGLSIYQAGPLLDNPYGVIAYQGYRPSAQALADAAACGRPPPGGVVEARYISDGRPLLQQLCQNGRSVTLVGDGPPPGSAPMGAGGPRPTALGTAGRVCGNVLFIAGTEVLMFQAEEFSRYADELDQASRSGNGVPFNAEACQPWCADYWQQAGWYYNLCDEPPADPAWAGSPGLPRPGAPHYNEVLGARLREGFGPRSHVYRCWQAGVDPAAAGFIEVPSYRIIRRPRDLRDMLLARGPDCFRPYDEFVVPDVERIPYYLPRGWRARQPAPACPGRGGQLQQPGGYDPPYQGGAGCRAAPAGGAVLAGLIAWLGIAVMGQLRRRRRSR